MKKILIIEDDSALQNYLVLRLKSENFQVLATHDEKAGLKLAKAEQPDLVICDLNMPKLNGFRVLKNIRQDPTLKHLAFLLMTGKNDHAVREQAHLLKANGCVEKAKLWQQLPTAIQTCFA